MIRMMKEDTEKETSDIHGWEEIILLKCPHCPKLFINYLICAYKNLVALITTPEKTILESIENHKRNTEINKSQKRTRLEASRPAFSNT